MNPSDAAMRYVNQIPGQTNQYNAPYYMYGAGQLPGLNQQHQQLINDPGGRLNQIGQSYQKSPGLDFAIKQALGSLDRQSIAQGMGGSPQNREYDIATATNYANQDYNQYMQNALGLYGQGLQGSQDLAHMGQQAGQSQADYIAQALAQQAGYGYAGEAAKNQQRNAWWQMGGQALGAFPGVYQSYRNTFGG